jgi:hypothetical protein
MKKTIYVPDDLEKRMKKAEKAGRDLNWSAIACTAFAEKLNALERGQKGATMSNVIERLRLSKQKSDSEAMAAGRAAGRSWAESKAEAEELQLLENAQTRDGSWEFGIGESAYSAGAQFFFVIEPHQRGDRKEADEFWDSVIGEDDKDRDVAEFVEGFAAGAVDLWEEVKDKI